MGGPGDSSWLLAVVTLNILDPGELGSIADSLPEDS